MENTFLHSGDLGDIIYALPTIRHLGGGKILWHKHEATPKSGPEQWLALAPLIAAQPYITGIGTRQEGDEVTHDFTHFRGRYHPRRTLALSQSQHLGIQRVDTWTPWLQAPHPERHGRPVFARSARYQNPAWSQIWLTVARTHENALFVGTAAEHEAFSAAFGPVEYRPTKDFAELANVIAGAGVFVGNQSSPYAVAEGLKVNSIQETHPGQMDCVYPRPNARFCSGFTEWRAYQGGPATGSERLMLALQSHPGDAALALGLCRLICDLEPQKRSDVDFAVCVRKDVEQVTADAMLKTLRAKFEHVHLIRGKRNGSGWPAGPNDLWAETMMRISMLKKEGKTQCGGVLTFEPDCVPLRANWIDLLKGAWVTAQTHGKSACGHIDTDPDHLNGNAIFKIGLLRDYPQLSGAGNEGWDTFHAMLLLAIAQDTPMISQHYRLRDYGLDTLAGQRKRGEVPALFHGVKGPEAQALVRDLLSVGR